MLPPAPVLPRLYKEKGCLCTFDSRPLLVMFLAEIVSFPISSFLLLLFFFLSVTVFCRLASLPATIDIHGIKSMLFRLCASRKGMKHKAAGNGNTHVKFTKSTRNTQALQPTPWLQLLWYC